MSNLFNKASWVMIPSGYEEDTVFVQKPTSGGDLTFTRSSDATRTNSAGQIERVAWNLLEQSETFSNAYWLKLNATIVANTTTAPNGTITADSIVESSTNGIQEIYRTPTPARAGTFTYSVYVKNLSGARFLNLSCSGTTSSDYVSVRFSPSTQTLSNVVLSGAFTNGSASFTDIGSGWYRVILTFTTTSLPIPQIALSTDGSNGNVGGFGVQTYTGNGTSGLFIWGAQLVEGTEAKPYLMTTNRQDVPRLDYRNADGTVSSCPRLLLEPQRTNLVTFSEQLDNAVWTKTNATITANAAVSPDGYLNADELFFTAIGGFHLLNQAVSLTSGTVYTQTYFVKDNGQNFIQIYTAGTAMPFTNYVNFDLTNGAISASSGMDGTIINYGGGWYRISATKAAGATNTGSLGISGIPTATSGYRPSHTGSGESIYIWGGQLEAGAYPTTYIPTTTAAVTRAIDASLNSLLTSLQSKQILSTQGTFFYDTDFMNVQAGRTIWSLGNLFMIVSVADGRNGLRVEGGVNTYIGLSNTGSGRHKFIVRYTSDSVTFFRNGIQVGSLSLPSAFSPDFFTIFNASFGYGVPQLINESFATTKLLPDAECITLTTI